MAMNSFGNVLVLTTFGESHGPAVGGVLDGFPPRFSVDRDALQAFVDSRRPGQGKLVSQRREEDKVEFLSGFSPDGLTLGTPIAFMVRNVDHRSEDYAELRHVYRPNHADRTCDLRYGIRDWRGGGRASARETLARVVAGGLALQWLESHGVRISANLQGGDEMLGRVEEARIAGDSIGGAVECFIEGYPAGIGNPVYDKFHARLAEAMMSINAAMGFEYGAGFGAVGLRGSQMADEMRGSSDGIRFTSNNCGGINGGITNGAPIRFRVAFKPTPTIAKPLHTVTDEGTDVLLNAKGRHDPCVAIRAVPVVRAMAALVAADFLIMRWGLNNL